MKPVGRAVVLRCGDVFFRWRSYLPLLLVFMVPVALRSKYQLWSHGADLAWEIACILLALGGFALRVWTVGVAAPGTSGRHTRHQKAATLNTTGLYSLVRHPLYLANGVIVLGLSLFTHSWIVALMVAVLTGAYYACIARREEQFLRERFGDMFERWAARVPAMVPVSWHYVPAACRFEWRTVVRREFYALTVILITPFLLHVAEDLHKTGAITPDPLWTPLALVGTVLFLVLRFLKKRTSVLAG